MKWHCIFSILLLFVTHSQSVVFDEGATKKFYSANNKYYLLVNKDRTGFGVYKNRRYAPLYQYKHEHHFNDYLLSNDGKTVIILADAYVCIDFKASLIGKSGAVYDDSKGSALQFIRKGKLVKEYKFGDLCKYPEVGLGDEADSNYWGRNWLNKAQLIGEKLFLSTSCCREYVFKSRTGGIIKQEGVDSLCIEKAELSVSKKFAIQLAHRYSSDNLDARIPLDSIIIINADFDADAELRDGKWHVYFRIKPERLFFNPPHYNRVLHYIVDPANGQVTYIKE